MSDDTPTQRLPEPESEPPTQRLETSTPAATADGEELQEEKKKSRALLIALIAIGAALVVAIIVLLIFLISRPGDDPSPAVLPTPTETSIESATPTPEPTESDSPTPSATPIETQAPPPPPPPTPIVSFAASMTDANCPDDSSAVPITFNWNTTGSQVSFGIATDFADTQPYQSGLPAVGGITVDYQCSNPETKFSIAVFHNGSVIDRETLIVRAD